MDIDEDEVTREPFYNEGSDENEDEDDDDCDDQAKLDTIDEENLRAIAIEDCEEKSSSSVCSDDIEFARSYNIRLQSSKNKAAALFDSEFIDSGDASKLQVQPSSDAGSEEQKLIPASVTSDCIYHKGVFLQAGDIVALCDQDDGQMYFAQLTGFVQDVYCEKSASVNWLVPIRPTSREVFHAADYKIGLEDTQLRKLDSMIFIRHSPSDYYQSNRCRQPANQAEQLDADLRSYQKNGKPYIWTTMKPCRAPKVEPNSHQSAETDAEAEHRLFYVSI